MFYISKTLLQPHKPSLSLQFKAIAVKIASSNYLSIVHGEANGSTIALGPLPLISRISISMAPANRQHLFNSLYIRGTQFQVRARCQLIQVSTERVPGIGTTWSPLASNQAMARPEVDTLMSEAMALSWLVRSIFLS